MGYCLMIAQYMLMPSSECQACCTYCFGPNRGPTMSFGIFDAVLDWIDKNTPSDQPFTLTFHGGEPLLVGFQWYQRTLPILRRRFGERIAIQVQSNLWLLDNAYCALFNKHKVSVSTSLDGPDSINDRQRGPGYFRKTMAGIHTARKNGMNVGVICTFTKQSAPLYRRILDFFSERRLSVSIHAAAREPDGSDRERLSLSSEEYAHLLVNAFTYYLEHIDRLCIPTFDAMVRGVSRCKGGICTFEYCLGHYLTFGPTGSIYPCNRLANLPEWRLGNVKAQPSPADIAHTPSWKRLRGRELTIQKDCAECPHFPYCKGGCVYNAISGGTGRRDPHCSAYQRIFAHITELALEEIFSEKNLQTVLVERTNEYGLLQRGKLLRLMRGGPHPGKVRQRAQEVIAAVALAEAGSPETAMTKLDSVGAVSNAELALRSLKTLKRRMDHQNLKGLANLYLHVTNGCNLNCVHCYNRSNPRQISRVMDIDECARVLKNAAAAGFRKAVITGGEPLVHPMRRALIDAMASLKDGLGPMKLVLRTNLVENLSSRFLRQLVQSINQIVISIDGDEKTHDERRGRGTYARTVNNLKRLRALTSSANLEIAAALTDRQIHGTEGAAVKALCHELGIRFRFRQILPIGRGEEMGLNMECNMCLIGATDDLLMNSTLVKSCGLGTNLYVAPDGACFPCHSMTGKRHHLGNMGESGLANILEGNDRYRRYSVDTNRKCGLCALRYLCGGFCRAWGNREDPDAPPGECEPLFKRAQSVLGLAMEYLDLDFEKWQAAGLPALEIRPG